MAFQPGCVVGARRNGRERDVRSECDVPGFREGEQPGSAERMVAMAVQIAKALLESPDFLRLGPRLALECEGVDDTR